MQNRSSRTRLLLLFTLLVALICLDSARARAQAPTGNTVSQQSTSKKKKPVMFKAPGGYMPLDFPNHLGKVMLAQKLPAGMLIVYPNDGESVTDLTTEIKNFVAPMFTHDQHAQLEWTTYALPAHSGVSDEGGALYSTSYQDMDVQLALYTRGREGGEIVYGYFAMRHKNGSGENGRFLDNTGQGVEDFDKFWKTIKMHD